MIHSIMQKDNNQYHDSTKENDDSDIEPGKFWFYSKNANQRNIH